NSDVIENAEEGSLSVPVVSGDAGSTSGASGSINTSAAFLAQLIGQDIPSDVQSTLSGVLAGYEKMVATTYVKYKPSDATHPPPAPSGLFGRLLQEEKSVQPQITQQAQQTAQVAQVTASAEQNVPVQAATITQAAQDAPDITETDDSGDDSTFTF